jgi:LAGLIDADG DNA endonuclease family/Proton-conducting membrane transporter
MLIDEDLKDSRIKMKNIAIIFSLLNFLISIYFWIQFDSNTSQFQFVYEFDKFESFHFNIGIDGISLYFVLLTTFITPIALLSDYTNIKDNLKYFLISFLLLETFQILAFIVLDLLLFYIYFESVLPLLFIIIVLFGHGKDRFRSAYLLFLYTLAGSLPMLLAILTIYNHLGSTDFSLLSLYEINLDSQKLLWLSFPFSKEKLTGRYIIIKNYSTLIANTKFVSRFKLNPAFYYHSIINLNRKKWLVENNNCKDLVIYGSILSSTVNFIYYNRFIRNIINIPINLNSIILGIILSDGHLFKNKNNNTLLAFKQTINRFDFFWVVFNKFYHFCQGYPRLDITRIKDKTHSTIVFATRVLPCFTYWHNLFYVNGKKIVPLDLYNLLDYEALAYWIMGDGTKSGTGLTLQTQSFTVKECVFIISILMYKFNLNCSIHMQRNKPTIYISSKSMKQIKQNYYLIFLYLWDINYKIII